MTLPAFGPAYDAGEALEILRIASAVDTFLPLYVPDGGTAVLDPTAPATGSPLNPAYANAYPSIYYQRWPSDWQAAIAPSASTTWASSIVVSRLGNQALLAGLVNQTAIPTYCLAFRGTMTATNVVEDFFALPVTAQAIPAGALQSLIPQALWNSLPAAVQQMLDLFSLPKSYVSTSGNVAAQNALVHLGFRVALESLDTLLLEEEVTDSVFTINSLSGRINAILSALPAGQTSINLYVTGHSLGAGMAALAAAWLATQPFPGYTINVKCYSFAQPKPGNDCFAYATSILFQQQGFGFYTILNSLDTVPQVPLTIQTSSDLNYWQGIQSIATSATSSALVTEFFDVVNALNLPYSLNYMHAGQVIALNGTPVVTATPPADQTPADTYTFPLNASGSTYYPTYLVNQQAPAGVTNDSVVPPAQWTVTPQNTSGPTISGAVSNLWQHMPFTYAQLLYQTLPT